MGIIGLKKFIRNACCIVPYSTVYNTLQSEVVIFDMSHIFYKSAHMDNDDAIADTPSPTNNIIKNSVRLIYDILYPILTHRNLESPLVIYFFYDGICVVNKNKLQQKRRETDAWEKTIRFSPGTLIIQNLLEQIPSLLRSLIKENNLKTKNITINISSDKQFHESDIKIVNCILNNLESRILIISNDNDIIYSLIMLYVHEKRI